MKRQKINCRKKSVFFEEKMVLTGNITFPCSPGMLCDLLCRSSNLCLFIVNQRLQFLVSARQISVLLEWNLHLTCLPSSDGTLTTRVGTSCPGSVEVGETTLGILYMFQDTILSEGCDEARKTIEKIHGDVAHGSDDLRRDWIACNFFSPWTNGSYGVTS